MANICFTEKRFFSMVQGRGERDPAGTLRQLRGGSEVLVIQTYECGIAENCKESDLASTLRVKEPYGGRSLHNRNGCGR